MVSDIHFDPFHDPAKIPQLVAAPVDKWSAIFSSPPSPDQKQAFDALQQQCKLRGVDTSYDLLQSSLQAMRARQADAKFMTVSGDLMAHSFSCRFKAALLPQSTQRLDCKGLRSQDPQLRRQLAARHFPVYAHLRGYGQ